MIKADTKYTPEILKAYRDYFISQPEIKKIVARFGLIAAAVIALVIYEIINSRNVNSFGVKFLILIFLMFGIVFVIRVVTIFRMIFSIGENDDIHSYTFEDEQFTAIIEGEHKTVELYCQYDHIKSAVENKNCLYINTKDNKTYIIGTDDLTEGTPDELRSLLKDKLGERYTSVK